MAVAFGSKLWIMAGNIPTTMPQSIVVTDPKGRSCIYVPITQDGKVVDCLGHTIDIEDD